MEDFQLELVTVKDIKDVTRIEYAAYGIKTKYPSATSYKNRNYLRFYYNTNRNNYYKIMIGHQVVGTVLLCVNKHSTTLYHIALDTLYRSLGYGSKILKDLLAKSSKLRVTVPYGHVDLLHWYQRKGFSIDSIIISKYASYWKDENIINPGKAWVLTYKEKSL